MIVVNVDGIFVGIFKKRFQETLLIPVNAFERGNHNSIENEGFHFYLDKFQKINSADKISLQNILQGVFFALYV